HRREHLIPTGARRVRVTAGREAVRGTDDAGEERTVGGTELGERAAEEHAGRLGGSVYREAAPCTEGHRGEIATQELVLGRACLEQDRERRLLQLPAEGPPRREEGVLHELLRDRAPTLADGPSAQVGEQRAGDRERIDPGMTEKVAVLGGEHRGAAGRRRDLRLHGERRTRPTDDGEQLRLEGEPLERLPVRGPPVARPPPPPRPT